jgi:hypothetical protein
MIHQCEEDARQAAYAQRLEITEPSRKHTLNYNNFFQNGSQSASSNAPQGGSVAGRTLRTILEEVVVIECVFAAGLCNF